MSNQSGDTDSATVTVTVSIGNGLWANKFISASSEYPGWEAINALGQPNTFIYYDASTAWAPLPKNPDWTPDNHNIEFLEVGFKYGVHAKGFLIRENYGNGFVTQVSLRDTATGNWTQVWPAGSGETDTSQPNSVVNFIRYFTPTTFLADAIHIDVDIGHDLYAWEEIDAVRLFTDDPVDESNYQPQAVSDVFTLSGSGPFNLNVLANDQDADGDLYTLMVGGYPWPSNGFAHVDNNETINNRNDDFLVYTPYGSASSDLFTYTVTDFSGLSDTAVVAINYTNQSPQASVPGPQSVNENGKLNIGYVYVSDSDSFDEDIQVTLTVSHGTLKVNTHALYGVTAEQVSGNRTNQVVITAPQYAINNTLYWYNSLVYRPQRGYSGSDTLTVTVNDLGNVGSGGPQNDSENVAITVNPANNDLEFTVDQFYVGEDAGQATISVKRNGSTSGTSWVDYSTSFLTATPGSDYDDVDGVLTFNPTEVTKTFQVTILPDDQEEKYEDIILTLWDSFTDDELATATLTILGNDSDYVVHHASALDTAFEELPGVLDNIGLAEYDVFYVAENTDPLHGSVEIGSDGQFIYAPDYDYVGTDTFTYRSFHGSLGTPITVQVTVTNDPLVGVDDVYTTHQDTAIFSSDDELPSLFDNEANPDGDEIELVSFTQPSHGVVTAFEDGHFVYSPVRGYVGSDTFTYTVTDGPSMDTATVLITLDNTAPVAVGESYTLTGPDLFDSFFVEDASVLENDTDADNNDLTATLMTGASHGTVSLRPDGTFTYDPVDIDVGPDSFTYQANDGAANSNVVTVALLVLPSDPSTSGPLAVDDHYQVNRNRSLDSFEAGLAGILANDSDPYGELAVLVGPLSAQTLHGNILINEHGHFLFEPVYGYIGPDEVTYQLATGGSATIYFSIVNDDPIAVDNTFVVERNFVFNNNNESLLANDPEEPNFDVRTVSLLTAPTSSQGQATINPNGTFTFTPANNYVGSTSFVYRVSDDRGRFADATVHLDVVQAVTWTGSGDGFTWSDAQNWNIGQVPGANSRVIIGAAGNVNLESEDTGAIRILELQGQLTVDGVLSIAAGGTIAGILNVTGTLELTQTAIVTLTGTANVSGTVSLELGSQFIATANGDVTLTEADIQGPGALVINEGTVTSNGANTADNTTMIDGALAGNGTFTIADSFLWSGGQWNDLGDTIVAPGGILTIAEGEDKSIQARTLDNYGRVEVAGAELFLFNNADIYNRTGAMFILRDDSALLGRLLCCRIAEPFALRTPIAVLRWERLSIAISCKSMAGN